MYVTVEGIDGAGKSTVVDFLHQSFPGARRTVEPSDELWTGEAVRTALSDVETSAVTDLFLFLADRAEHLERVVRPALGEGRMVVSDRSADSTYAYQSHRVSEMGVVPEEGPWEWFDSMYEPWDLEPDLTLYLDVPVDVALGRCDEAEKYEKRDYLEHVKNNYETLAGMHRDRYVTIDADRPPGEVARDAVEAVRAEGGESVRRAAQPLVADGGR